MRQPRSERTKFVAAVGVMLLLTVACGTPERGQGVAVRAIGTDVGLGAAPADAGPANVVVRRARRPTLPKIPDRFTLDPSLATPLPVIRTCPAAGPFDFPKEEAGIEPKGIPASGVLSWKFDGTIKGDTFTQKIDSIVPRIVSNVVFDPSIEGAFRYTITDTVLFDGRAQQQGSLATRYLVIPKGPAETDATSRDEGRGMYITSMVFRTFEDGQPVEQRFDWVPPVLMFPFPAVPGLPIEGSGVNVDGSRLSITGRIAHKEQIDACGDRIDSWLVDGRMVFEVTDPDTFQRETFESGYDYNVALQFGSLLVGERINSPRVDPILKLVARVGQVPRRGDPSQTPTEPET